MAVCYQKREADSEPAVGGRATAIAPTSPTRPAAARPEPRVVPARPYPIPTPVARPAAPERTPAPMDGAPVPADPATPAAAVTAWRAGHVDDAMALLARHAADDTTDPTAPYLTAKIFASLVRLDEAHTAILQALGRDPVHAPSHYLHGLILQEQNRPTEALDALRRAVYLDPHLALGRFSLAVLFASTGQPARAEKELDTLTALLSTRDREELLDDGDGVTVGRLLELVAVHRDLIAAHGRRP